uniref:WGS project CBMI000000000 data, contig CS3069_c004043 n=1 Tax=Fusarium clavum TaxID=2594811 RepID=A0A090MK87_9HYPO|nr:unnamed protein product [Fusarium clavum]
MSLTPVPIINVTGPNGEQEAAVVFSLPAKDKELCPPEDFLPWREETSTHQKSPASAPLPAIPPERRYFSDSDVDAMPPADIWDAIKTSQAETADFNAQKKEDSYYNDIPDIVAD